MRTIYSKIVYAIQLMHYEWRKMKFLAHTQNRQLNQIVRFLIAVNCGSFRKIDVSCFFFIHFGSAELRS